jgi:hypothetical protein
MPTSPSPLHGRKRPIRAPRGRSENAIPTTVVLDRDSKDLLRQMTTGRKSYGAFVAALIRAEWARIEERRRLRELLETQM